ncbi:Uncharacterised protein [Burkholderia pseudomallei]|nr:Uncharacterised protein [Burkholderia pseudomallei]
MCAACAESSRSRPRRADASTRPACLSRAFGDSLERVAGRTRRARHSRAPVCSRRSTAYVVAAISRAVFAGVAHARGARFLRRSTCGMHVARGMCGMLRRIVRSRMPRGGVRYRRGRTATRRARRSHASAPRARERTGSGRLLPHRCRIAQKLGGAHVCKAAAGRTRRRSAGGAIRCRLEGVRAQVPRRDEARRREQDARRARRVVGDVEFRDRLLLRERGALPSQRPARTARGTGRVDPVVTGRARPVRCARMCAACAESSRSRPRRADASTRPACLSRAFGDSLERVAGRTRRARHSRAPVCSRRSTAYVVAAISRAVFAGVAHARGARFLRRSTCGMHVARGMCGMLRRIVRSRMPRGGVRYRRGRTATRRARRSHASAPRARERTGSGRLLPHRCRIAQKLGGAHVCKAAAGGRSGAPGSTYSKSARPESRSMRRRLSRPGGGRDVPARHCQPARVMPSRTRVRTRIS